jgi:DNA modification methylase
VNTYSKSEIPQHLLEHFEPSEIGLAQTPEAFVAELVAVFREVRRVLRDDGTLWLNLGDSYARSPAKGGSGPGGKNIAYSDTYTTAQEGRRAGMLADKQLIGIPWRVAFALQQPYYTGQVANEIDRVWLAAMLDAEGSICGTEYLTGDRTKTNLYISITNTSVPIIDRCERLFPQDVKHVYEKTGPSSRVCYRWDVECMETKALFIREIYPYLVAKRKQAIVGYTFLEMQRGLLSKKKGYLPEQQDQRSWLMATLSKLNAGEDVDLPDWMVEPPSLFEPGYYLRQDIIWSKPNPMPESVRDRCTKAHEYLFLLSKSPQYYFDSEAIAEEAIGPAGGNTKPNASFEHDPVKHRTKAGFAAAQTRARDAGGFETRNKRSVWSITSQPFSESHFATMPPALAEQCIKAGCQEGGTVLDPFFGAGTTGLVANRLQRNAIGVELNAVYIDIAKQRIYGDAPLFAEVDVS